MENLVFLVDSNIFLEGLLEQEQSTKVQSFLKETVTENLYITNFSLHSIGVLLTRVGKIKLLRGFVNDVILNRVEVLSVKPEDLNQVMDNAEAFSLDFDDAYQYTIAKIYNLQIVSFDKDFDKTDIKRKEPSELL